MRRRIILPSARFFGRLADSLAGIALAAGLASFAVPALAQTPIEAGYRDFDFGEVVNDTPTGEKPQSKLWWNDGFWWGILWDPASNRYEIHKLNLATQAWTSTNVAADTRGNAKGDALWDGARLYIAFHVFSNSGGPVSPSQAAQLYRYSYDAAADQYTPDFGFPVTINGSNSETLVLAKDGTGQLWITWIQSGDVMVNHSVGNDLTWGTPYRIPIQGNDSDADDISSVIALPGKIGVLWSNQDDEVDYFAIHLDGAADNVWQPRETALIDGSLSVADDHISMVSDAAGNLYVATKTSLNQTGQPLNYLLRRTTAGVWSHYVLGLVENDHTRPIVQLDDGGNLYVFMASPLGGRERIYLKTSPASNIQFPTGMGTPFISSVSDITIRNPSGTKQMLNSASDLLVVASDQGTDRYFHNLIPIGGTGPAIASFLPVSGVVGTEVTVTGSGFTGATSVTFNAVNAPGFIVDSANQIRVNVPGGATSGPIRVFTPLGTAVSSTNFTIQTAPTIASFLPTSGPPGTEVTLTGTSYLGTTNVTFNGASATFTVDSNTQLRANVPGTATSGSIAVTNGVGTGTSVASFAVTAPPPVVTFIPIHDARVQSNNPTTNYGTGTGNNSLLRVRTGPEIDSYLKFSVSGLNGPVVDARLRLFCTDDSPDGGSVYAVSNNYLGTSTPWVETGLVWNNAPSLSGAILDQRLNVATNTWVEFDVTPAIAGNGTFSLGVSSGLANVAAYQSKEHANPPQLVVTMAAGAPTIASFTPTSGPPGTVVTITGSNFGTVTAVAFNGVAATFVIDNGTQLRATLPATATSGPISITNAIGTTFSASNFTVTPPTITAFTPTSGPIGTQVTITGTQFGAVSSVRFNGVSATFVIDNPTRIRATVPPAATSGPISVVNPAGSSASDASFTVILPPTIAAFSPISGPPGTVVTVTGTNLIGTTAVTFNSIAAAFTVDSPTQLRATVPPGASTGPIGVTNLAGTTASASAFTITVAGAPTIAGFTPTSGPVGTLVSINGTQFSDATTVTFGGVAATFTINGATQLTATVPGGAATGPIAVTNGTGTAFSATNFIVTAAQSSVTLNPTNDARVQSDNPTTNYGSGSGTVPLLRIRTGPAINSYLKFNVTGLEGSVASARLRLFCQDDGPSGGAIYAVSNNYLGTSTPWLESGLIWNNAPTIGGTVLDQKGAVAVNTWVEFDVTAAVTGNGTYSFGLTGSSTNIAGYTSKESTTPPELVLTVGSGTLPVVTSMTPPSGPVGVQVTISGVRFLGATQVTFNGTTAAFTVDSDAQIRTTVPVGASTAPISVTTPAGTGLSPSSFVVEAAPTIASFTPASGPPGTEVTVLGAGFSTASGVTFSGSTAAFVVDLDTRLRATVPAGAVTGLIRITNPLGSATSATSFTVTAPPPELHFTVVHDSRVQSDAPTGNYGTNTVLRVRSATSSPAYRTYLKFDVTGVGGAIQSAKVRLNCNDDSVDGGSIYSVSSNYLGTSTSWVEGGLNWNNAPAISGTLLTQAGAVSLNTWVEFDVTSAITGNGTYSFGMISGSSNIAGYNSKETTFAPELVLMIGTDPSVAAGSTPDAADVAAAAPAISLGAVAGPMALGPARPNPFSSQVMLRLDLPRSEPVRLVIFDVMGRRVRILAEGPLEAGAHEFAWNARDDSGARVEAGIYLVQLEAPDFTARRKVVFIQ